MSFVLIVHSTQGRDNHQFTGDVIVIDTRKWTVREEFYPHPFVQSRVKSGELNGSIASGYQPYKQGSAAEMKQINKVMWPIYLIQEPCTLYVSNRTSRVFCFYNKSNFLFPSWRKSNKEYFSASTQLLCSTQPCQLVFISAKHLLLANWSQHWAAQSLFHQDGKNATNMLL